MTGILGDHIFVRHYLQPILPRELGGSFPYQQIGRYSAEGERLHGLVKHCFGQNNRVPNV